MAKKESKSSITGSDYSKDRLVVPWNAGIDGSYGDTKSKTVESPAGTTFEPPVGINKGYDKLWEGK